MPSSYTAGKHNTIGIDSCPGSVCLMLWIFLKSLRTEWDKVGGLKPGYIVLSYVMHRQFIFGLYIECFALWHLSRFIYFVVGLWDDYLMTDVLSKSPLHTYNKSSTRLFGTRDAFSRKLCQWLQFCAKLSTVNYKIKSVSCKNDVASLIFSLIHYRTKKQC